MKHKFILQFTFIIEPAWLIASDTCEKFSNFVEILMKKILGRTKCSKSEKRFISIRFLPVKCSNNF